jgi:hypothetical protein
MFPRHQAPCITDHFGVNDLTELALFKRSGYLEFSWATWPCTFARSTGGHMGKMLAPWEWLSFPLHMCDAADSIMDNSQLMIGVV